MDQSEAVEELAAPIVLDGVEQPPDCVAADPLGMSTSQKFFKLFVAESPISLRQIPAHCYEQERVSARRLFVLLEKDGVRRFSGAP